jgi:hypothetical protein
MWKLSAPDRLEQWKRFRKNINELEFEQALEEVAKFWARAPFTPFYLEQSQPETWPDPWTLIAENYYCDIAKALGILYTIHLSDHNSHDLRIQVYKQHGTLYQYNLVWVDGGKYVLNLESEEVVNKKSIPDNLVHVIEYSSTELKLDRY